MDEKKNISSQIDRYRKALDMLVTEAIQTGQPLNSGKILSLSRELDKEILKYIKKEENNP